MPAFHKMTDSFFSFLLECGESMVMPNHFHCILFNNGHGNPNMQNSAGIVRPADEAADTVWGEHPGSPLRNVIQWYKTMSTNEYIRGVKTMGWKHFEGKSGHINYWEHIIRTQHSYDAIAAYILHNPQNWDPNTQIKGAECPCCCCCTGKPMCLPFSLLNLLSSFSFNFLYPACI